jgi:hypothetical protein
VNHYERLKVSPDAPAKVIRAAYRALATKLHPDRQGGDAGPTEEAHEAMAALNASYLVLTNAKARVAYDAQLQAEHAGHRRPAADAFQPSAFPDIDSSAPSSMGGGPESQAGMASTNTPDFDWLKDKQGRSGVIAAPIPRWAWALLFSALATAAAMGWVLWNESKRMSFDRSLTQMAEPAVNRVASGVVVTPPPVDALALPSDLDPRVVEQITKAAAQESGTNEGVPALSSDEMDKLSNEELLARMPHIMEGNVPPAVGAVPVAKQPVGMPKTSALPVSVLPWKQPAHHLDGGQSLVLKLTPTARLLSATSGQP